MADFFPYQRYNTTLPPPAEFRRGVGGPEGPFAGEPFSS
jgi:hypothetical protein